VTINWSQIPEGTTEDQSISVETDYGKQKVGVTATRPNCNVTVNDPAAGVTWYVGQKRTIQWSAAGTGEHVRIELYYGGRRLHTITPSTGNDGNFNWTVDNHGGGLGITMAYEIKVVGVENTSCSGTSGRFAIDDAPAPELSVSPTSFRFQKLFNPGPDDLLVRNSGVGTLTYTLSADKDWVLLSSRGGESTGETDTIKVGVDWIKLRLVVERATITVDSNGGKQTINVSADPLTQELQSTSTD
jgi:hypothetical protein